MSLLAAVEDRVRDLERTVRLRSIYPQFLVSSASASTGWKTLIQSTWFRTQLAEREGDAAVLVATNEKQVAETAKLTALLRTLDTVSHTRRFAGYWRVRAARAST